jgi:tight adherence protein B
VSLSVGRSRGHGALPAAVLGFAVLLAQAWPALAQTEELAIAVRDSSFEADGSTSLIVNVTGSQRPDVVEASAFGVTENGEPIADLTVEPLLESAEIDLAVVMALDVSGSMAGEPLESMKTAAVETVETLTGQGVEVGLVAFAGEAEVLSEPTLDAALLSELISGLEADGATTLLDAVVQSVVLLEDREAVSNIIVFADGGDSRSAATLEDAISTANDAGIPVTVVAFESADFDPGTLEPLAEATEGGFFTPTETAEFSDVFADVAGDVASQYVLTYSSALYQSPELDVDVTVEVAGAQASTAFVVANPRDEFAVDAVRPPPPADVFDAGVLGRPAVLFGALAVAFVAVLLVLLGLFYPRGNRAASRTLRRGVTLVQRGERADRPESALSASSIGRSAIDLVEKAPKPEGYDDRVQRDLDRAGWQLRASEFTTIRVVGVLLGFVLLWALTGSWLFGLVGAVAGAMVPSLLLSNARSRRQKKFMAQLPDTLQLLAGTLKAGYGVLQAIDTVVKESEDPMSSEFQRALTEARLGLPLEDSLGAMAERVDSDDFRWVVVAMNIQRQVGGNLAELLETVAQTLRGREQVRGQIQTLSAEGRLSAAILFALPFGLLAYLLLTNPGYLTPLFTNAVGVFMMIGAVVLMLVGWIWIRRLIKIEV